MTADSPEDHWPQGLVDTLAAWFQERLDPGERAALRRTRDPAREAAYWRLLFALGLADGPESARLAWAEVMRALSFLADLHDPAAPLGRALGRPDPAHEGGGFTQLRFERLLSASGERLHDEVRAAVRFLASKGARANVADLARLLLLDPDADGGKRHRRRLARDYFRAVPQDGASATS